MGAQIKKEISIMKMIRHRCVHTRLSDVAPCRARPGLCQKRDFHLQLLEALDLSEADPGSVVFSVRADTLCS